MAIPTLSEWNKLKATHKVTETAVTKALNAYWASGANTPKTYMVAYTALEKAFAAYITKVDKKKIKDYPVFEKAFLDKFLGQVHKERMDTERGMATLKTYQAEIAKFMSMAQKLDKKKATALDLSRFKSGPARGLSAMASQARGLTADELKVLNSITAEIKKVDTIVDTLPADIDRPGLSTRVEQILVIAKDIAEIAQKGGIIAPRK